MSEAISNQGELLLAIGRLEGKMDSLLQSYENLEVDIKDLSRRVNTLEKERSRLYGAGPKRRCD